MYHYSLDKVDTTLATVKVVIEIEILLADRIITLSEIPRPRDKVGCKAFDFFKHLSKSFNLFDSLEIRKANLHQGVSQRSVRLKRALVCFRDGDREFGFVPKALD